MLEVRRAVAQLLLVNRAGRELLHRSIWFPNPSTKREGPSQLRTTTPCGSLAIDDAHSALIEGWREESVYVFSLLPRKNVKE